MGLIIEIIFILVLIIIVLANLAMLRIRKDLKSIENGTKLSGFEVARILTSKFAEEEPHIIKKKGLFLDYYDSNRNVLKLSPEVFDGEDMYAALLAANLSVLTRKEKRNKVRNYDYNNFIVMSSYILIALGAFLNNYNVIYFGMILFILAFIFSIILLNVFAKNEDEINEIYKIIKKEQVIKPFTEEEEKYFIILCCINIARLPYGFINNFR